jgi:hypothetical protein
MKSIEIFIAAEGEEGNVDKLVGWCRNGFLSASVSGIAINETTVKGYQSFDIVRDNEPDEPPGPRFSIRNRAILLKRMIRHFLNPTKNRHPMLYIGLFKHLYYSYLYFHPVSLFI